MVLALTVERCRLAASTAVGTRAMAETREKHRFAPGEVATASAAAFLAVVLAAAAPVVVPSFRALFEGYGLTRELTEWHELFLSPWYGLVTALPVGLCLLAGLRAGSRSRPWWWRLGLAVALFALGLFLLTLYEPLLAVAELLGP
jgi:hypothetical protein